MFNLVTKVAAAEAEKIGQGNPILVAGDGKIDWPHYVGVVVGALIAVTAFASMIYLIWGAIRLITSSNESAKVELGRRRIMWAVIGLLITAASYAIWNFVLKLVGLEEIDTGGL
jgi:hypothetical protein